MSDLGGPWRGVEEFVVHLRQEEELLELVEILQGPHPHPRPLLDSEGLRGPMDDGPDPPRVGEPRPDRWPSTLTPLSGRSVTGGPRQSVGRSPSPYVPDPLTHGMSANDPHYTVSPGSR